LKAKNVCVVKHEGIVSGVSLNSVYLSDYNLCVCKLHQKKKKKVDKSGSKVRR